MNFLELCQAVRREAGLAGNGPTAVTNQRGIEGKIVEWVKRAYNEIQTSREDWRFLKSEVEIPLIPGQTRYKISDYVNDYAMLDVTDFELYESSRNRVPFCYMENDWFQQAFGKRPTGNGRPQYFTIDEKDNILINSSIGIGEDFEFIFGYYTKPNVMVESTDTPNFPEQFHDAILYKALMFYAADEEAANIYQDAAQNYRTHWMRLNESQHTHHMLMPPPLA